ncbi:MAG: lecithin retinol acyltransferase family protein [Maricaulaceae bacterium]
MTDYPFEKRAQVHPAGTLLMIRVFGLVKHFGIATGYGTVIHTSRRFGRAEESDFDVFCDGRIPTVMPYSHPLSGSEIVARARSRKGQRYNVITNNCEHFITWVLEGKGRSSQLGPLDGRRLSRD